MTSLELERFRAHIQDLYAQKLKPAAAKLATRLRQDRDWNLFVTILWIGSRDFEWMAPYVVASQREQRRIFDGLHAGGLVSWADECLKQLPPEKRVEADPAAKLCDRLIGGEALATGMRMGVDERRPIPREQWLDLHFPKSGPGKHAGKSCAYGGDPCDPAVTFWSRIAFDSASVLRTFPVHPGVGRVSAEREAERQLRYLAIAYERGEGPIPVGVHWRESAEGLGLSKARARAVWDNVAEDYPALASRAGKPRPRPKSSD